MLSKFTAKILQSLFIIIYRVPNAKAGRDSLDLTIYGMVNVPQELIQDKYKEKLEELKKRKIDPGLLTSVPIITDNAIPLNVPTLPVPPPVITLQTMGQPMGSSIPPQMMPPPGVPGFVPPGEIPPNAIIPPIPVSEPPKTEKVPIANSGSREIYVYSEPISIVIIYYI